MITLFAKTPCHKCGSKATVTPPDNKTDLYTVSCINSSCTNTPTQGTRVTFALEDWDKREAK